MEARQATLADLLTAKGYTQASFARRLKVSESQVSRWCNGLRPSEARRRDIARALKVNVTELW